MTDKNAATTGGEQIHLLDELQSLLEKQIKLARQDNITDIEHLSQKADKLVEKIAQAGILELAEFSKSREHLQKLYNKLRLALSAEATDIAEKLSRIRKGRKIIKAYRSNI